MTGTPPARDAAADDRRPGLDPTRLGGNYVRLLSASTISNIGDGIGVIAYPWLASAITRNPLLIAVVVVVQRLPWLLFSLPAGVITDRHDRRRLMVGANTLRAILTIGIAAAVLARQGELPGPAAVADAATVITTNASLYVMILVATLLLGVAEVLYDNSAQTFLPSIVHADQLETANGRMWSFEVVANTFAGPPLAAFLIAVSFSLPFFVDAATFALSACLIAVIRPPARADRSSTSPPSTRWTTELADGFRWLWSHDLLRTLAVTLGFLNLISTMSTATFVLFGQEVLDTSPTEFAILGTGAALGGVIGGWTASNISRRIGPGPSLSITLVGGAVLSLLIGLSSWWPAVWFFLAVLIMVGTLWNVITVSFRQTVIPDHLLGRVNSVYRFFGWGMMPIGAALGGLVVMVTDAIGSRELAQRMPWFAAALASIVVFVIAAPRLTTAKFEAARADAAVTHTEQIDPVRR